jgi:hypothetical protein
MTAAGDPGPRPIADVLEDHRDRLLSHPRITAVAEGDRGGRSCVVVFVDRLTDEVPGAVPAALEGHPVVVEEAGPFDAGSKR